MDQADRRAVAATREETVHRLDAAGEPNERGLRRRRVDCDAIS